MDGIVQIQSRLIDKALKKHGLIKPCSQKPFTFEKGSLIFWYNINTGSTCVESEKFNLEKGAGPFSMPDFSPHSKKSKATYPMGKRQEPIMHTSLMRKHLHDFANKLASLQGGLDLISLGDVADGPARDSLELSKKSANELCMLLSATRDTFYGSYRQSYDTYKGEPPLLDSNGVELKLHDEVIVPNSKYSDDFWMEGFKGEIISTTVGEGLVSVKDPKDNCWRINAQRVTKVTHTQEVQIYEKRSHSLSGV